MSKSKTGMLGNSGVLRQLWGGPLLDLALKLNSENGPEIEVDLKKFLRGEMIPVIASTGVGIVKTVVVNIGGGRTTGQIIEAAQKLEGPNRPTYIDSDITQTNTPSGHGRARASVIEFFEFDHDPLTDEIRARCEEPGYGYPTYEDGLRFQEQNQEAQRERPHVFVPENPCISGGGPQALYLWGNSGGRKLSLGYCGPGDGWDRRVVFARRKYLQST